MKSRLRVLYYECKSYIRWLIIFIRYHSKHVVYDNIGRKVVAVGNGPSAGDFPYEEYKRSGYDFLCVNFFALDEEKFFNLKPAFYCCIDNAFSADINSLTVEGKKLVSILNRVDWQMKYICLNNTRLPFDNDNISVHIINHYECKGKMSKVRKWLYNHNKATYGYQNVMLAAIYYLIMSRVETIVLTGVENDWHRELYVAENNDVYRELIHFYGKERINITEKGQIKKGELYKYFYYYYITLHNYSFAASYAEANGINVYNSCKDSYIDVFEKKAVDSLC